MVEFFDIKRKMITKNRSCYYTVSYTTEDGIVGKQKIICLNQVYALATEDSHNFKYVSRFEFSDWAYRRTYWTNSCHCSCRDIKLTKEELLAIENFILKGQRETGKFRITGDSHLFLNCREYCISLNDTYLYKSDLKYVTSIDSPLYKILSKNTCINIRDEVLREPHPVLEDIGYIGTNYNFVFTCPVCQNKNSPAGYLGWPTKFYNNNKCYIRDQPTKLNAIIINDPNIQDAFLFSRKRELFEFSTTYALFCKIRKRFFDTYYDYTFRDYCYMCKALDVDPDINDIKTTDELQKRHDKILNIYQFFKKTLNEENYNKIKILYPDFLYEDDEFLIRYPETLKEIVDEGSALHHCVGSYCDRVLQKHDYILFLRKKSNPNNSFVTIDLINTINGYECKQVHGKHNCLISDYPEAELFINQWFKKFNILHPNINKIC